MALIPEVTKAPPPSQGFELPGLGALAFGLFVISIVVMTRRKIRRPKGAPRRSSSSGVGNALIDFNAMLLADRPKVEVIRRLEEEDHEDGIGDQRP